jgi:hypothetical protein
VPQQEEQQEKAKTIMDEFEGVQKAVFRRQRNTFALSPSVSLDLSNYSDTDSDFLGPKHQSPDTSFGSRFTAITSAEVPSPPGAQNLGSSGGSLTSALPASRARFGLQTRRGSMRMLIADVETAYFSIHGTSVGAGTGTGTSSSGGSPMKPGSQAEDDSRQVCPIF